MKKTLMLLLLVATPVFSQQVATKPERSTMEQKGYDEAKKEDAEVQAKIEADKQKADADKKKAEAEAEEKRRTSSVTYSVTDEAERRIIRKRSEKQVKKAMKLEEEIAKEVADINAKSKLLQELSNIPADVQKVASPK